MDLYLIRHAEAGDRAQWNGDDAERPLTEEGHEQARQVGQGLRRRGVTLEALVSSPLVRARQTAEGVRQSLGDDAPELETCDALAPGGKRRKVARFLQRLEAGTVALFGHMPDMGALAGWLIGSRKAQIDLAKAGVALIRFDDEVAKGAGKLVWMVTPEWLAEPEVVEKRRK